MLRELRIISFKKYLFITVISMICGGLCAAMLVSDYKAGKSDVSDISGWVGAFLFLGAAAFFIIGSLSGLFQKPLKKYCEQGDNLEKVEQFYYNTEPIYGVRVNEDYVLAAGLGTHFLLADNLLWVYMREITLPPYFQKATYIYFMPKEGKPGQYKVKKKEQGLEILEYIHRTLPWVIMQYSDELEKLYQNDRQVMINAAERAKSAGRFVKFTFT